MRGRRAAWVYDACHASGCAHARASARGTPPSRATRLPPHNSIQYAALRRERRLIMQLMREYLCVYISERVLGSTAQKRNLPRSLRLRRTDRDEVRIYGGRGSGGRVHGGKYLFAAAVPQDQSLRRWCRSVSWTILHSGTGIMRGLIGRSSTSNRSTRDGCNLQGKWSRNSSPSERNAFRIV